MTTMAPTNPTLLDLAKRLDPDKKVADIIEVLSQTDEILQDVTFVEGNLPTGHRTTIRTGLPSVTWRLLNYGVQPSKSRTAQITDTCGMLESYSKVDVDLAKLAGDGAKAFLFSEELAFIQAMQNEFTRTLFYGNTAVEPEKFMGFSPRYYSLSSDSTEAGYNCILFETDDTGEDYMSIWLVVWGPQTVHCIVPKNSTVGLQRKYLGVDVVSDGAGGEYQAHRTHFKWDVGLCVRDWRYVVRLANIDTGTLTTDSSTGDLADFMIRMVDRIPNLNMGRPAFYMPRYLRTMLRRQVRKQTNLALSYEQFGGRNVLAFDGIPIRSCDSLTLEGAITQGSDAALGTASAY